MMRGLGLWMWPVLVFTANAGEPLRAEDATATPPVHIDVSPVPNYVGDYVSLGLMGNWRAPEGKPGFSLSGIAADEPAPRANCSPEAIRYYAAHAPRRFDKQRSGLLYGVKTHTSVTAWGSMPGYNSCALVVYAILRRAGCRWARHTANAKDIYDMAYDRGWRPAPAQRGGCIVAWNSRWQGQMPRIGRGWHRNRTRTGGVMFRHVGVTTGRWIAVDNTSFLSRPTAFFTTRPIRYEPPLFLCPPGEPTTEARRRRGGGRKP